MFIMENVLIIQLSLFDIITIIIIFNTYTFYRLILPYHNNT